MIRRSFRLSPELRYGERMQNGRMKASVVELQEAKSGEGTRATASLGRIPARRADVLIAEAFCAMLAVERRRAQRSLEPFVLILLDAGKLEPQKRDAAFMERLIGAVSGVVRESDIIGWYRGNDVLGVIFTELGAAGNRPASEIIHSKILKALGENLESAVVAKVVVSVHQFPENWDQNQIDQTVDHKLYPELPSAEAGKNAARILKRGIDIAGSLALLLLLSPVLAAIALAIKLTSRGPAIFRQERIGQSGKTFECLKFRTMYANNDPKIHREYVQNFIAGRAKGKEHEGCEGAVYKIQNDPRVTTIGRFLRRTSLDELPQFFNVLRGEMSLVGPRPPLAYEFAAYDLWHRRRVFEVKPGVTGLWQVTGRSRTSFDEMVRLDLRYCQRWSLWLDLKILLATPAAVFKGSGAY